MLAHKARRKLLLQRRAGNIEMDAVNISLFGTAMLLGGIVYFAFRPRKKKKPSPPSAVSVTLKELSKLWARGKETGEIHINDLAPIWREEKSATLQNVKDYAFHNEKLAGFFAKHIDQAPWFKKAHLQKEICYQILLMLEREGECSSVVNAADDVEASWDSNTYTLLGRTTLLDHTLNVAREAVTLLSGDAATHVIPDAMIAALGHDLGKLLSIKGHMYSLGEHPLAAGRVLAELPAFKQLARKSEISRAIKLHHKRPEGLLGQILKKADQLARQKELEWAVENTSAHSDIQSDAKEDILENEKEIRPEQAAPSVSATKLIKKNASLVLGADAAWRAQADIFGEDKPSVRSKDSPPQRIDISSWFDAQAFLEALQPYINRITGRRFMAFSMSNGYVYFQAKVIEEVARKQAEQAGAMDIATMAADDISMREVLFTVVDHLRVEHEVIARELIRDQYFGGYFSIATGGKALKGFYTPFHAEAFGSIAAMERNKKGILKNFTSVEPFVEE